MITGIEPDRVDDPERFTYISPTSDVSSDVALSHPVNLNNLVEIHANVRIGAFAELNTGTAIHKNVEIGRFCSFGRYADIGIGHHPLQFLSTHSFVYTPTLFAGHPEYWNVARCKWNSLPATYIGNDVWVGAKAAIMAGTTIGDGAVIGAGAVVLDDVPPYAIVAGIPARLIRFRFDQETVEELLELRWWDLPLNVIGQLPFDDVGMCLEHLRRLRASEGERVRESA